MRHGFFFLLIVTITGCYSPRYIYSSPAQNVPVLNKKNDAKIAAYYSTSFAVKSGVASDDLKVREQGFDLHGAWAYNNHGAVQSSFSDRRETNDGNFLASQDSITIQYHRKMAEIGIGYYQPVNARQHVNFQFFAGLGFGRTTLDDFHPAATSTGSTNFFDLSAFKIYLQPAIYLNPTKNFCSGFSSRLSVIQYYRERTDYSNAQLEAYTLAGLTRNPAIFWEPCFLNSLEFKKLPGFRLESQVIFTFLFSRAFVDARPFNFSLGAYIDPFKAFKRKDKSK